ncbi:hypothetical protein [Nocardioides sp. Iso805N]|uniref:hypothetical protein n=1 Tax=Nocardioides sp. Iso805N TaxID=1283287 RepID=UPI0012FC01C0|nr:hypothetical protein [Nocardioides sp. Iso805N]
MRVRVISRINAALAALLALVLILLAIVLLGGNKVLPWKTPAEKRVDAFGDVQAAATRSVLAFLDVDYQHMDDKAMTMESLSTGPFKKEYAATAVELKAAAQRAKAVSTGDIRYVGVNSLAGSTAKALVAADAVVENTATKGQKATRACPHDGARCHQYRFVVTMQRTGGTWKLADLAGAS